MTRLAVPLPQSACCRFPSWVYQYEQSVPTNQARACGLGCLAVNGSASAKSIQYWWLGRLISLVWETSYLLHGYRLQAPGLRMLGLTMAGCG